jgi:hypothetical protein
MVGNDETGLAGGTIDPASFGDAGQVQAKSPKPAETAGQPVQPCKCFFSDETVGAEPKSFVSVVER